MPRAFWAVSLMAAVLAVSSLLPAQFRGRGQFTAEGPYRPPDSEFHFVRIEYTDAPEYSRGFGFGSRFGMGRGWWMVDWPDADEHFSEGIGRLTRITPGAPRHFRLTDEDRVFDYPWIYATQTGSWGLSDKECLRLREYLQRGGFLVTDDMWGTDQWEIFRSTMARVLPGKPIPDLVESDPVMHVLYDIREKDRTFIPGSRHLYRGAGGQVQIMQPAGTSPAWRAIYDDRNHMVVAVNYDTDVADAWEFADAPFYPEAMTALAYRYGINYIIYSMTH